MTVDKEDVQGQNHGTCQHLEVWEMIEEAAKTRGRKCLKEEVGSPGPLNSGVHCAGAGGSEASAG